MIFPTLDVVVKGAEEILRWSRTRLETSITARNNQIVQSVQEVLSLVKKHRIGGRLHLSLFLDNDNYYQFPPDVLWSVFIPECRKLWSEDNSANDGIKSFPFEREEVEQALYRFNDAAGAIIRKLPNALFKRCSCISTGRSQVCVPPSMGWNCMRPALLVRMNTAYESRLLEKRQILEEERRIDDAVSLALSAAKSFLATDDGMMLIREEAEKEMALEKKQSINLVPPIPKKISRVVSSLHSFRLQSQDARLKQLEERLKLEYISDELEAAKDIVMERNSKIQQITEHWRGVTTSEVFAGWKACITSAKKLQRRKNRQMIREERMKYEDDRAEYELKKLEVSSSRLAFCI